MKLQWFQDEDGTYFRNVPINLADRRRELAANRWLWRTTHRNLLFLEGEAREIRRHGIRRTATLPKGDTVVRMKPFRESHPDCPVLWTLDERKAGA